MRMRIRTADGSATYPATFGLVVMLDPDSWADDGRRWMYLAEAGREPGAISVWMSLGSGHVMHWENTTAVNQFVAVDHVDPEIADANTKVLR